MTLAVRSLSFRYGGAYALRDISFELEPGRFMALLGPNGAGKSTLLKCLCGILTPCSGEIIVGGQDASRMSWRSRAEFFGYVPQYSDIRSGLNVLEVVSLGCSKRNIPSGENLNKTVRMLERMELEKLALRDINELSGGERQRVLISRALVQSPGVLLLDEPANNLDMRFQHEIMVMLRRICEERAIPAIASMHDLTLAFCYADEILILDGGVMVSCGNCDETLNAENVLRAFGMEASFLNVDGHRAVLPIMDGMRK